MKKVLIVILIIVAIVGFLKVKQWWTDKRNFESKQAQEILKLKERIQEDSSTISTQALVIDGERKIIDIQSTNIKQLRKKYNSKADSFIKLQTMFDSLKSERDTIFVIPDSLDPESSIFIEKVGEGYFEIVGSVKADPIRIYNLYLHQRKPFTLEVAIDRTGNDEYVSYVHYEPSFLNVSSSTVKVLDKRRWIDKIFFGAQISAIKFGAGVSLYYGNYGIGWMQFTDGNAIMFNYLKNIGEIF
ncbi:MAG: hypothetical protein ACW96U_00975 [Candidatus Heimdallarchaeaceae archaeon]|jgi:hypothetical protein